MNIHAKIIFFHFRYGYLLKLDGCIIWNAHNTVLGSKRLAICATV